MSDPINLKEMPDQIGRDAIQTKILQVMIMEIEATRIKDGTEEGMQHKAQPPVLGDNFEK